MRKYGGIDFQAGGMGVLPVHFFGQKALAKRPCHLFFKQPL